MKPTRRALLNTLAALLLTLGLLGVALTVSASTPSEPAADADPGTAFPCATPTAGSCQGSEKGVSGTGRVKGSKSAVTVGNAKKKNNPGPDDWEPLGRDLAKEKDFHAWLRYYYPKIQATAAASDLLHTPSLTEVGEKL